MKDNLFFTFWNRLFFMIRKSFFFWLKFDALVSSALFSNAFFFSNALSSNALKFDELFAFKFKSLKNQYSCIIFRLTVESGFESNFWIQLELSSSTLRLDPSRVDSFFFWTRLDSSRIGFWDLKSTRVEPENYVIHQNFYKLHCITILHYSSQEWINFAFSVRLMLLFQCVWCCFFSAFDAAFSVRLMLLSQCVWCCLISAFNAA